MIRCALSDCERPVPDPIPLVEVRVPVEGETLRWATIKVGVCSGHYLAVNLRKEH